MAPHAGQTLGVDRWIGEVRVIASKGGAEQAADYYNAADVMTFYRKCWGGEAIHIGLYRTGDESVGDASAAMTDYLLSLAAVEAGQHVIDIACGFGGTVRKLVARGCRVSGFDIAKEEIAAARETLKPDIDAGLVTLDVGDFHRIESADNRFDAAICQEAIIHSHDRLTVFDETFRVLKPGGVFVFSDILTAPGADLSTVQEAFDRLRATAGATPDDYQEMARKVGFDILHCEERVEDIRTHYEKLEAHLTAIEGDVSPRFFTSVGKSIATWRAAIDAGDITWACFLAKKPG